MMFPKYPHWAFLLSVVALSGLAAMLQYTDEKYADVGVLAAGAVWYWVRHFFEYAVAWGVFSIFLYTSHLF